MSNFEIVDRQDYSDVTYMLEVRHPAMAKAARAGQFVIVMEHGEGERIPLTLADFDPENGTITLLLVTGFTGALGTDLDTNNDGVFDSTPWTNILDSIGVTDATVGDLNYSSVVLTPSFDGGVATVGGVDSNVERGVSAPIGALGHVADREFISLARLHIPELGRGTGGARDATAVRRDDTDEASIGLRERREGEGREGGEQGEVTTGHGASFPLKWDCEERCARSGRYPHPDGLF